MSRLLGPAPLLVAAAAVAVGPDIPLDVQYAVLVVGGLVIGIPHGAVDWAALPIARTGAINTADMALVGLLYALLGGVVLVLWAILPGAAAVGFLLLTWFHWGQGDLHTLRVDYATTYLGDRIQALLTGLVRGGIPMVVPLLAFPETYRRVLETFVQPFGGSRALTWLGVPDVRLAVGGGLLLATVVCLARGWMLASSDGWRVDAAETASLWLTFLLVPPVLAIGLYFACWHSWRHLARLAALDAPTAVAIAAGDWIGPFARFGAAAVLPSLATLGLIAGLWQTVSGPPSTLSGVAGLALVAIAALTLPHTVIVTWLDCLASTETH